MSSASQPVPEPNEAQWRANLQRALGAAPFETLISRSYDNIAIGPLYEAGPGTGVWGPLPGSVRPWRIVTRVDDPDEIRTLEEAAIDIAQGADGLDLVFSGSSCDFGLGLSDRSRGAADRFFNKVEPSEGAALDLAPPCFGKAGRLDFLRDWSAGAEGSLWTHLRFGFDPLSEDAVQIAEAALEGGDRIVSCFCADGRRVHAAGGSEAQELAFVLAASVAALRAAESAGAILERARSLLSFALACDTDFYLTIAKFRALRLAWTKIEAACNLAPAPAFVRAEAGWRMLTKRDPWTNVLRAALATAAAAIGGADSITALPFTRALGAPDSAARRLARNTQLVLLHEANLGKVGDPAAGAGAFESLTHELCSAALREFREIDREGGLAAALRAGSPQANVARTRAARQRAARARTEAVIGTSDFPDSAERPLTVLRPLETPSFYFDLPLFRVSEPFEAVRDQADAVLAALGARPRIFLGALGSPAATGEGVAFARNLFEAGGLLIDAHASLSSAEDTLQAFLHSGARIACLCPARGAPENEAGAVAQALAAAGARRIYVVRELAGVASAPSDSETLRFIRPGCDALAVLGDALACAE